MVLSVLSVLFVSFPFKLVYHKAEADDSTHFLCLSRQARERQRREEEERLAREAAEEERKHREEEEARERAVREAAEKEAALARMRQEKALSLGDEPEKGPNVTQVMHSLVDVFTFKLLHILHSIIVDRKLKF